MKQACSLESMVDAVLSEMKRRGNAKNTIERHERAYSQFYEYALTQGENSYSKVLARSFLEEKEKLSAYRGPRFMEQYRIALNKLDDIAKGQDSKAAFQHIFTELTNDLLQLRFERGAVQFLRATGPPCMPELVAAAPEVHADTADSAKALIFFGVLGIK